MKTSRAIVSGTAGTNTVAAGPVLASLNVTSGGPLTISAPPDLGPIGTGPGAAACGVTIPLSALGTPTVHPTNPADNVTATTSGVPANNFYPAGVTTVTWTATEGNQTAQATQRVTVKDTTPPTLTVPPSITVLAVGSTTLPAASLTATATDNCPGPVTVTSAPPSSFSFPQGSTAVAYTATDAASNKSTGTQTVTVTNQPVVLLQQLLTEIATVPQNVRQSLLAHLNAAILTLSRNNARGACMQINAFVNEVKRQTGITISAALAGELTLTAGEVQDFLGCTL
jgi:hypothetical protein